MNKKKAFIGYVVFLLLLGGPASLGRTENTCPAALQVSIQGDNGSAVHFAHVYIFSENKKKFFGTRNAYGVTTFELPAGDYRVYAALTLKSDGIIDHYTSPEALVHLSPDEPTSVVLALQKAVNNEMILSDTAREKLGIDEELAKYIN